MPNRTVCNKKGAKSAAVTVYTTCTVEPDEAAERNGKATSVNTATRAPKHVPDTSSATPAPSKNNSRSAQNKKFKNAEMTDLCELEANDCDQGNSGQRLSHTSSTSTTATTKTAQRQSAVDSDNEKSNNSITTNCGSKTRKTTKTARSNSQRKREGTKNDDNNNNNDNDNDSPPQSISTAKAADGIALSQSSQNGQRKSTRPRKPPQRLQMVSASGDGRSYSSQRQTLSLSQCDEKDNVVNDDDDDIDDELLDDNDNDDENDDNGDDEVMAAVRLGRLADGWRAVRDGRG